MAAAGGGVIVNMASESGLEGSAGQSVYAASKAAVYSLTRSWAKELGPLGVRVVGVAPGPLEPTGMTGAAYMAALANARGVTSQAIEPRLRVGNSARPPGHAGRGCQRGGVPGFAACLLRHRYGGQRQRREIARMSGSLEAARQSHRGVFITAPGQVELRSDRLPEGWFAGGYVITESLGNSVCSSDQKAVQQFTGHARIPGNATEVALGHETVHRVVAAPPGTPVRPGQVVLITPGLSSTPVDPDSFAPDPGNGVLAALGYSFRYAAGLRRYSGLPERVATVVAEQGMGELFIPIPAAVGAHPATSLATLTHAEPFACCRGALRQMFTRGPGGDLVAGVPPDASVAMLSGTGRMAMITLAILARSALRPRRIAITGSAGRLRQLAGTPPVRALRSRGVTVDLVDRGDRAALAALRSAAGFDVVITFYANQESYDLAADLVRPGGNFNNFAGASDPEIVLPMTIPAVPAASAGDVRAAVAEMIHPEALGAERRIRGLATPSRVALAGFAGGDTRVAALLCALPAGTEVAGAGPDDRYVELAFGAVPPITDLFIAGSGGDRRAPLTATTTPRLARDAAVNFLDGGTEIGIRSRHVHYMSRHQVCGPTVPYYLTNTSGTVVRRSRRARPRPDRLRLDGAPHRRPRHRPGADPRRRPPHPVRLPLRPHPVGGSALRRGGRRTVPCRRRYRAHGGPHQRRRRHGRSGRRARRHRRPVVARRGRRPVPRLRRPPPARRVTRVTRQGLIRTRCARHIAAIVRRAAPSHGDGRKHYDERATAAGHGCGTVGFVPPRNQGTRLYHSGRRLDERSPVQR